MVQDKMRPVHPGEILREDVLQPLGMSARGVLQNKQGVIDGVHAATFLDTQRSNGMVRCVQSPISETRPSRLAASIPPRQTIAPMS